MERKRRSCSCVVGHLALLLVISLNVAQRGNAAPAVETAPARSHVFIAGDATGNAYLLYEVVYQASSVRKPTWIALSKPGDFIHLPVDAVLARIAPAQWRFAHLDFGSLRSGIGTRYFGERPNGFRVDDAAINYVGRIVFSQRNVEIQKDASLLTRVCGLHPELFERLPVRFVYSAEPDRMYLMTCTPSSTRPRATDSPVVSKGTPVTSDD